MNIVRAFIEDLSWCQCHLLSTLQLHHDGALQHVNKRMCIVSVDSARPAGRMLDRDYQSFPAGILRKILRYERRDLRLLSHAWHTLAAPRPHAWSAASNRRCLAWQPLAPWPTRAPCSG